MLLSLAPRTDPSRVAVRSSPTRCPYCHASCVASDTNVVCNQCLARHHAECWAEAERCANCAACSRLEPVACAPSESRHPSRKRSLRRWLATWGILLLAAQAGLGAFARPGLTPAGYLEALGILTLSLPVFSFASGWFSRSVRWAVATPLASGIAASIGGLASEPLTCSGAHLLLLWPVLFLAAHAGLLAVWLRTRSAAPTPTIRLKPRA